jgi:hypothetical protein
LIYISESALFKTQNTQRKIYDISRDSNIEKVEKFARKIVKINHQSLSQNSKNKKYQCFIDGSE